MTTFQQTEIHSPEPGALSLCATNPSSGNAVDRVTPVELRGMRALLVEDSWHVAEAMRSLLENIGIEIVGPAGTLANAERLAESATYDLAVVDINLRGEMAYGLIERLCDRGIPVVIISGNALPPSFATRVAAVLQKPVRIGPFMVALRRIADQRGAQ